MVAVSIPGIPLVYVDRNVFQDHYNVIECLAPYKYSRIRCQIEPCDVFRPSGEFDLVRAVFGKMFARLDVDTYIDETLSEPIRVDGALDDQVACVTVDSPV
jgi:hypothetical protein